MSFSFPTSPTVGQLYDAGNAHWTFNGYAWVGGSSVSGASVSPPPPPPVTSTVYPFVSRPMPGANTTVGDPQRGDYKTGRLLVTTPKNPLTATMPLGVFRDAAAQHIRVESAASGTAWDDYDMRGGWTMDFGAGIGSFTIRNCLFDNAKKSSLAPYYACIDGFNNSPTGIVVDHNDFVGFKTGTFEEGIASWLSVHSAATTITNNYMYYPPGDHIKTEGGLIEGNFCYGGGTTPGAHFDCVQVAQLNSPLTIRYNHFHGLGAGDSIGATNVVRAVPNDSSEGVKMHQILCYENVMRGMGYQIENHDGLYLAAQYHTNWQGDWQWGPHTIAPGFPGIRYYGNKVLSTGVAIPDINPP